MICEIYLCKTFLILSHHHLRTSDPHINYQKHQNVYHVCSVTFPNSFPKSMIGAVSDSVPWCELCYAYGTDTGGRCVSVPQSQGFLRGFRCLPGNLPPLRSRGIPVFLEPLGGIRSGEPDPVDESDRSGLAEGGDCSTVCDVRGIADLSFFFEKKFFENELFIVPPRSVFFGQEISTKIS